MPEAACTALGLVKVIDQRPFHSAVAGNYHLADAFAVLDDLWLIA
jgi:hypothetical protein